MGDDLSSFSLLDLFRQEAQAQVETLNSGLVSLEAEPTSAKLLESLMRAAHSLKGGARLVELPLAVKVAHALEDVFVAAQKGQVLLDPGRVDVLLKAVDLLARLSLQAGQGPQPAAAEVETVLAELAGLAQAKPVSPPPPAAAPAPPAEPAGPTPAPPPAATAPLPTTADQAAPTPTDRVVRINSDNLNRIMALAGEHLVESGWLKSFVPSFQALKAGLNRLAGELDALHSAWRGQGRLEHGGLAQAQRRVGQARRRLARRLDELDAFGRRSAHLASRLYAEVVASRMRPFGEGVQGFPRLVRDLARQLGKQVRFTVEGQATPVDREILERLEAPLNHLLRNALDHGLEPPAERAAVGKPAQASLTLAASHQAGFLVITVADDGRGVDPARLQAKVVERGLAPADLAAGMTEAELLEFLFLPGFSTAERVTEVSGRGVGLDVVRAMVKEVGGELRINSRPGRGLTLTLKLPLTLSVLRTLVVEVAGEPYAIPLLRLERLVSVRRDEIRTVEDRPYLTLEGQAVGLVPAVQALALGSPPPQGEELAVVVVADQDRRYGLAVDRFLGEQELVVRPLDERLGKIPGVSAAAVLPDGSPTVILDVEDLIHHLGHLLAQAKPAKVGGAGRETKAAERAKRVLVVDDSLTVREVERRLLENAGYQVVTAVDGQEGWSQIRTGQFDLVVTDVDMPRLDGLALTAMIKADEQLKPTPVVIVSYKDNEADRLRGLSAGANYYLTKSSFQDEGLVKAVADLIGEARS